MNTKNAQPFAINVQNLNFSFDGATVFKDFSFTFPLEKTVSILGKSGVGKTTLLLLLAKLLKPQSGTITYIKNNLKLGFVFQDLRLLENLTALENITYILPKTTTKKEAKKYAQTILADLDLKEFEDYSPLELSGGMQHRLAIARAIAYCPDIFFLDEAFASLDSITKKNTVDYFINYVQKNKKTAVCVTHDLQVANTIADIVLNLSDIKN